MKEKKEFGRMKAGGVFGVLAVGFVAAFLLTSYLGEPMVEEQVIHSKKIVLGWLGDPAGDTSGLCMFSTYPHQAVPATAYATNLTTGACY